ncbi:hypothetical protein C8Q80DRAFT_1198722 [Daedaleopsis nitida]|nr:hypothetical protein C8Q80DRAFT_1198722 [Daedaleopsis nitida]
MISILSLPAELRQPILLLSLPDECNIERLPPSVWNLLHVSRSFRSDMDWVISHWAPTHIVPNPTAVSAYLSALHPSDNAFNSTPSQTISPLPTPPHPRFESLRLYLFHNAKTDDILRCGWFVSRDSYTHDDLMNAWITTLPTFLQADAAKELKTIIIDATPVPGFIRAKNPNWLPLFLHDRRVSKRFLGDHTEGIAELIAKVVSCAGGGTEASGSPSSTAGRRVRVELGGEFGPKSSGFIDELTAECERRGITLPFTGTFINWDSRSCPRLMDATKILTPVKKGIRCLEPESAERRRAEALHRLVHSKGYCWSRSWPIDTERVFGKASALDVDAAMECLKVVLEFKVDEERTVFDMEPAGNVVRKLAHCLARDLEMATTSLGEDTERFVRIDKLPQTSE